MATVAVSAAWVGDASVTAMISNLIMQLALLLGIFFLSEMVMRTLLGEIEEGMCF